MYILDIWRVVTHKFHSWIITTLKFNGLIFHPDSRESPPSGISSDISSPVKVTGSPEASEAFFE